MPLPAFESTGDLPPGIHRATLEDVMDRFGAASGQRELCTRRLSHIFELARGTGHLKRFIVFGSYVTAEKTPNDVDVVLVMEDEFQVELCPIEVRGLFDHAIAQARYGASVFWIRPSVILDGSVDGFLAFWQTKRDGFRRGIVEVVS
jgi:hypothetical protein